MAALNAPALKGRRHVIVGDGAAGMRAAEELRRLDAAASITVVSDDPHPTYFRAALTNYLLGELRDEQIWAVSPSFYRDLQVQRVFGRVLSVDATQRQLALEGGGRLPYETLLIASGARARVPTFSGATLPSVMTLRTLRDARSVMDSMKLDGLKRAVVLGGGPLALEWAHAMKERGTQVTLLIRDRRIMAGAMDAVASDLVLSRLKMGGIEVIAGDEAEAALPGANGQVGSLRTKSGRSVPCELVAAAIGVVCNTEFLEGSGIVLGKKGGVHVDAGLRTSVANVFAAGDVAEVGGQLLQLWEPAKRAAQVAAQNMNGGSAVYSHGTHYFATRLYDLDFAAAGKVDVAEGADVMVDRPPKTGQIAYRKLVFEGNRLVGALLLGERAAQVRQRGRLYQRLIDAGTDVSSIRGDLLDVGFDLRSWLATRALVAEVPKARALGMAPALLRGTQRIGSALLKAAPAGTAAALVHAGGTAAAFMHAAPAGPAGTVRAAPLLSIGLKMPLNVVEAAGAPERAWLEGLGRRFPLSGNGVGIGRLPPAAVLLTDREVSGQHAQIVWDGSIWYLRDAGSRNGTWVNGQMLTDVHQLAPGDHIRVGNTDLVFGVGATGGRAPELAPAAFAGAATAPAGGGTQPDRSATPSNSVPLLEVVRGPGVGLRFALTGSQVTVGRDPQNQVRVDDVSISRRHAMFTQLGGRWYVVDLQSSAGSFKNDLRFPSGEDVLLEHGDKVTLGGVQFRFLLDGGKP